MLAKELSVRTRDEIFKHLFLLVGHFCLITILRHKLVGLARSHHKQLLNGLDQELVRSNGTEQILGQYDDDLEDAAKVTG